MDSAEQFLMDAFSKSVDTARKLDAIDVSDSEKAHCEADYLLLMYASPQVRNAYRRLEKRARWWAAG